MRGIEKVRINLETIETPHVSIEQKTFNDLPVEIKSRVVKEM